MPFDLAGFGTCFISINTCTLLQTFFLVGVQCNRSDALFFRQLYLNKLSRETYNLKRKRRAWVKVTRNTMRVILYMNRDRDKEIFLPSEPTSR